MHYIQDILLNIENKQMHLSFFVLIIIQLIFFNVFSIFLKVSSFDKAGFNTISVISLLFSKNTASSLFKSE